MPHQGLFATTNCDMCVCVCVVVLSLYVVILCRIDFEKYTQPSDTQLFCLLFATWKSVDRNCSSVSDSCVKSFPFCPIFGLNRSLRYRSCLITIFFTTVFVPSFAISHGNWTIVCKLTKVFRKLLEKCAADKKWIDFFALLLWTSCD